LAKVGLRHFRSGVAHEEEVQPKIPQHLRGGVMKKKKPQRIQEQEKVEAIPAFKKKIFKIHQLEIKL
jgi:hypothetical protein